MDEARRVLERLERIDRLRRGGGSRAALLAEVQGLLADGERWLAAEPEGTERAEDLLEAVRRRLEGGKEVIVSA